MTSIDACDEYDAIVATEVIEHLDNPEIFLRKHYQVLQVDGSFFLTTINRSGGGKRDQWEMLY